MVRCPRCDAENASTTRFCGECGARIAAEPAPVQVRKTVTILFTDVTGSTALGEQLDPESLRALMGRYFSEIESIVIRHGGTVEKFIGDAAMAVFGIPRLHEDDALRAVRAALEIRDAIIVLNTKLETQRGLQVTFRTGVNTGQVVTGDDTSGQTLVTGDAVNTAARLEQAATPGEILLGMSTYRLVRGDVVAEPVDPIVAKGKSVPVQAVRLLGLSTARGKEVRQSSRLVGRTGELARLQAAHALAVEGRTVQLVTVVGPGGVGKSRLVGEFLDSIHGTTPVLRGRCLPYGEAISYWPLREIVHAAAGITEADGAEAARAKVGPLLDGARDEAVVAARIAAAVGLSAETVPQDEIFWASRRWLEHLARDGAVVLFEDVHWAQPVFLDLVEYIADHAAGVPLLIICSARPELDELRPGWGAGRANATTVVLEGLGDQAVRELLAASPAVAALPSAIRERIVERAEGNPLFVEESVAMLIEDGVVRERDGIWVLGDAIEEVPIPPSIGALLAARIDALPREERLLAERASVAGRSFEATALRELARDTDPAVIASSLVRLVRKALLRPDRSDLTPGDAFRFRHMLIRDAAYQALAKVERASLHERFADWLAAAAGDRLPEYQEILAYHLQEAHRYLVELGGDAPHVTELALRAGHASAAVGTSSRKRGDAKAAVRALEAARALLPMADPVRVDASFELAIAVHTMGRTPEASLLVVEAKATAHRAGDQVRWLTARLIELQLLLSDAPTRLDTLEVEVRSIISDLAPFEADHARTRAWRLLGMITMMAGRQTESLAAFQRALEYARSTNDAVAEAWVTNSIVANSLVDATPLDEAIVFAKSALEDPNRRAGFDVRSSLGCFMAEVEEIEAARGYWSESEADLHERGDTYGLALHRFMVSNVLVRIGRPAEAVPVARAARDALVESGETGTLASVAPLLARALFLVGRTGEGSTYLDEARAIADDDDTDAQMRIRLAAAELAFITGDAGRAADLAEEAVALADGTEWLELQADARMALGRFALGSGRIPEGAAALRASAALYERKGNVVSARISRELLSRSGADVADGLEGQSPL